MDPKRALYESDPLFIKLGFVHVELKSSFLQKANERQGKIGNNKTIGPLDATSIEILKEFCASREGEYVFSRGGNITPKFYKILRRACRRAGVLYGKNTPGGLVLHDSALASPS
jgi:hypothetical protein